MTHTGRCHPSMSRLLAPVTRSIRVNRASAPVRLARAGEARILKLNRERPHFWRFAALGSLPVQQSQTLTFLVSTPSTAMLPPCSSASRVRSLRSPASPPWTPPVRGDRSNYRWRGGVAPLGPAPRARLRSSRRRARQTCGYPDLVGYGCVLGWNEGA